MTEFVLLKDMHNYLDMVDELLMVDSGLYDSEITFLDKLVDEWEGCFTVGQANWLEKIWERMFK